MHSFATTIILYRLNYKHKTISLLNLFWKKNNLQFQSRHLNLELLLLRLELLLQLLSGFSLLRLLSIKPNEPDYLWSDFVKNFWVVSQEFLSIFQIPWPIFFRFHYRVLRTRFFGWFQICCNLHPFTCTWNSFPSTWFQIHGFFERWSPCSSQPWSWFPYQRWYLFWSLQYSDLGIFTNI